MPTVHPRMCGEHFSSIPANSVISGSSPHVRGTRRSVGDYLLACRFIPACAGNTTASASRSCQPPVHPRMCGEHTICTAEALLNPGSSPHVRGTLPDSGLSVDHVRFIPACAGNTTVPAPEPRKKTVHPRMCGEHDYVQDRFSSNFGSSPHVRGTLRCRRRAGPVPRFIPACAGNTRAP